MSPDNDTDALASGQSGSARVFTVPTGLPFLASVTRAILSGDLPAPGGTAPDPLALPDMTILLPTRRATRVMQEAFLTVAGGRAMTLPQIRPISAGEEDLTLLAGLASPGTLGTDALELPPAVSEIERRLTLTMLVQRWSETIRKDDSASSHLGETAVAAGANTPAQAVHLSAELARLMDMVETENVALSGLAKLVPDEYSAHWQDTLKFLEIITAFWPAYLDEKKLLSPAERRNRAILAEAERLTKSPPSGPVIVAGVTGSVPATVELMRAVASLPQGALVLPGLDLYLDEESWRAIKDHPEHPQFGFHKLLADLGVSRSDVEMLPGETPAPDQAARAVLVSETMRPSGKTGLWQRYIRSTDPADVRHALGNVSLIEAPSAQDEAEVIALILREAAETPGRTAALVSPDRLLARRVAVRLEAWGIRVDDSAGRPFAKTPPGTFLDLVVAAVAEDFSPAATMALLKHPLTRLGLDAFAVRRAARALEIAVFRDVYLGRGIDGVADALERADESKQRRHRAVQRLWDADWAGAHDLVTRLREAYEPLINAFAERGTQSMQSIAAAHIAAAEALCQLPEAERAKDDDSSPLWQGEAGAAASSFFAGLINEELPALAITAGDYPDLYRSLIVGENVRPRVAVHPRLSIWGPFEARLQQPDVIVLGSLNDGTWPEAADPGPWLNRPMRAELGLPSPEATIGHAAHDFTSLLGASRVYLTRAEKIDGVPTVPSRWLMRLQALLAGFGIADALEPDQPWLGWARARDHAPVRERISAPEPRPPLALRPRKLSVTRIETWLANPYAIFARDILKLDKLPELGTDPNAALRGNVVHEIMSRFAVTHPGDLPPNAHAELMSIARAVLIDYVENPRIAAFWLPRFARFAEWFADSEPARRNDVERIIAEVSGRLVIDADGGPFTLTARADRIDVTPRGIVITDYKTGTLPTDKQIADGMKPQLPLEAAIAMGEAGFPDTPRGPVIGMRYIRATGAEPPGEDRIVGNGSIDALATAALVNLTKLISHFDDEATPYKALRRARFSYEYDDYAHLARVAEWSVPSEEEASAA
ncbi:ATP-dependent helicase/nuclease subunit B [Hyphomicrobium sp. 1Nfss2.1]|uniref:double-strand break repair protein AddB n=1 Tax=Hyphomicrobium sp. 1Nfss2.1 TaxID=3413936 RepID=UPI003C7C7797